MLFSTMSEGYALHEIILDEAGTPVDCRFLETNDAFERVTGLTRDDVVGKTLNEVLPGNDPSWFVAYGRVALTGESDHFESYSSPLDRWFDVYAFSPSKGRFAVLFRDITERKDAEAQLLRQRDLFTAVSANTQAHLVYLDREFNFIWVNPAYASACGRTQEEFVGHNHFEFYPHEENQAIFERVRDTGMPFETRERPFMFSDHPEWGVTYWDWTLTPMLDSEGVVSNLVFSLMDVTHDVLARQEIDRLRTEAERRAEELQVVLDAVPAAVWSAHDPDCLSITGNRVAAEILNVSPDANMSKSAPEGELTLSFRMLKDGRELHPWEMPVQLAASGAIIKDFEFDFLYESGAVRHMLGNATPLLDEHGRPRGSVAAFMDITDRKRVEQALRESERRLNRSQEIAGLGSWELDLVSNELVWSDEVYRIFGLEPDGFGATYEAFLQAVHPDDRAAVNDAYFSSLREGRDAYEIEHRVIRVPDGEVRTMHERCEHIRDESGRIVRSIGMVHDITKQVEFERERDELYQREHRIAEALQQAIVPAFVPDEMYGYTIAVKYRPALKEAEIGGDFYDVFDLGDGKIGILIGDVAGKGLPAAIRVAEARHTIRSYAFIDPRPARVMTLANEVLCREMTELTRMVTAFFAVVDTVVGAVTYTCAGHEPPVVCCPRGRCDELMPGGMPLGVASDADYTQLSRRIEPGDRFVMVTDGITEARAKGAVLFGRKGVVECLRRYSDASPAEVASGLLEAATKHVGGDLQDDVAIIVFENAVER